MTNSAMSNGNNTESIVMKRVYRIRALRPLLSNAVLALVLLAFTLYGIGREVWVAMVFRNAPHTNPLAALRFFTYAFLDTRFIVQALCVIAFLALVWFVRDLVRGVSAISYAGANA